MTQYNYDELTTFHGDPELKLQVIERLLMHEVADSFTTGIYGDFPEVNEHREFRGCALGCTLIDFAQAGSREVQNPYTQDNDKYPVKQAEAAISVSARPEVLAAYHNDRSAISNAEWAEIVARVYGLPTWLCHMDESVFEAGGSQMRGDGEKERSWPRRLIEALPIGVEHGVLDLLRDQIQDAYREESGHRVRLSDDGTGAFFDWRGLVEAFERVFDTYRGEHPDQYVLPREPQTPTRFKLFGLRKPRALVNRQLASAL